MRIGIVNGYVFFVGKLKTLKRKHQLNSNAEMHVSFHTYKIRF